MIYGISVETTGLEMAVNILADVVLRPVITDEYLEMIRTTIRYDNLLRRMGKSHFSKRVSRALQLAIHCKNVAMHSRSPGGGHYCVWFV